MALENYTGKIADLVVTNPTPTDPKSQGDDHLRGIKYTLMQSFPGFDGPLNATRVPFTPAGNISSATVQGAIVELDNEKVAVATLANSPLENGYQRLPGGLIDQWGVVVGSVDAAGRIGLTFPTPFVDNCFSLQMTNANISNVNNVTFGVEALSAAGVTVQVKVADTGAYYMGPISFYFRAIGV